MIDFGLAEITRSLAQCEYIAKMKKVEYIIATPRLTPKQCPDIKVHFV